MFVRVLEAVYHAGASTIYKVAPLKRLGDPFLLDGETPPLHLCLKETVPDGRSCDFLSEDLVELLKRVRHPNLVRVHGTWTEGERSFLLLDWVPGGNAASRYLTPSKKGLASKEGVKAPGALLRTMADGILGALEALAAPEIGLMHCDITPHNIAFDEDDNPVLIDVGSVQPIASGIAPTRLTPPYAPIELYPRDQLPANFKDRADIRPGDASDRYMLAASIYAMAAGIEPQEIHTETGLPLVATALDRANGAVQTPLGAIRPDLTRPFTLWVDDLLGLSPDTRFESHTAARQALKTGARAAAVHDAQGAGGDRDSASGRPGRPRRRRPRVHVKPQNRVAWGQLLVLGSVLMFAWALFTRYPLSLARPWIWPRLMAADALTSMGNPATALKLLSGAEADEWDRQILLARARMQAGAPVAALTGIQRCSDLADAPKRVKEARAQIAMEVGGGELQAGLLALERGERFPAFVHLKRAERLGVTSWKSDWELSRLYKERIAIPQAGVALDRFLKARPTSVKGQILAADLALGRKQWRVAQDHATHARELAAGPKEKVVDPVDPAALAQALGRVSSALVASVPDDPAKMIAVEPLQENIERLMTGRWTRTSPSICGSPGITSGWGTSFPPARRRRGRTARRAISSTPRSRNTAPTPPQWRS